MKKISHIKLGLYISKMENLKPYSFWICLGSIAPDFDIPSLIRKHNYENTYEKRRRAFVKLQRDGVFGPLSCFSLGIGLHYLADYFTYPHNNNFSGSTTDHWQYEQKLVSYFADTINSLSSSNITMDILPGELFKYVETLHEEYLTKEPSFSNDTFYILQVAVATAVVYRKLFSLNTNSDFKPFSSALQHS